MELKSTLEGHLENSPSHFKGKLRFLERFSVEEDPLASRLSVTLDDMLLL